MARCPYCTDEPNHVNNHVRMSNDDDHGPAQTYPDDWDPEAETRSDELEEAGSPRSNPGGQTVHGLEDDPENTETGASEVSLADSPADAREYECGECNADVPYLSDCPECNNSLKWQGVGA